MKILKQVVGSILLAGFLFAGALIATRPNDIHDWWKLRNYTPSERVSSIAATTTMTSYGKKLFYVYDPQIEPAQEFNQDCTIAEASIVLGCYNGRGIYVFDVSDPRLAGVHEVTAAHEMLHAGYDRLSSDERAKIDAMTADVASKITDPRLLSVIESYRARDPGVVPNELHSILGTEVRILSPELEEYYKKYFVDRLAIVALSERYEQVFTDEKAKVEAYDAELKSIKAQIDDLEASLSARAISINAEKATLDRLSASKQYSAFNARVPSYNSSVNAYNSDLKTYKSLISEYNQKVEARNAITVEQNSLIQSLDSKAQALE